MKAQKGTDRFVQYGGRNIEVFIYGNSWGDIKLTDKDMKIQLESFEYFVMINIRGVSKKLYRLSCSRYS